MILTETPRRKLVTQLVTWGHWFALSNMILAIAIANDTDYGLQAYVFSSDDERAYRVARQINAGRVLINGLFHEPQAPFGGFMQSGQGREFGVFGLETHLEPKAIHAREFPA
mgnify:CR=1 FL=1